MNNPFDSSGDDQIYQWINAQMQPALDDPMSALPVTAGMVPSKGQAFKVLGDALQTGDMSWLRHLVEQMFHKVRGEKEATKLFSILDKFAEKNPIPRGITKDWDFK
jgi:hypothetical protein